MTKTSEVVLNDVLEQLNFLVAAETESAVRKLQRDIEDAVERAVEELRSSLLASDEPPDQRTPAPR